MATEKRTALTIYKNEDKTNATISKFGKNLNLAYLAGKLDPCCHRDEVMQLIQKTMLRKNKANVLLTGPAGCGKTAIAEGLAAVITEKKLQYLKACSAAHQEHIEAVAEWDAAGRAGDCPEYVVPPQPPLCDCVLYELSLNSMVGGTKYRGEFEERLQAVIDECRANPNIILFVDEFHCILHVGASAEDTTGAGQILKPALARGDIRVIGATTTEDKKWILGDKALARRFCEVEVRELQGDAAMDTANKILKHYCAYHKVSTDIQGADLVAQVTYHLPNTVFPDNFINVVDETLAGAVFDGQTKVGKKHFYQTLSRMSGHIILDLAG